MIDSRRGNGVAAQICRWLNLWNGLTGRWFQEPSQNTKHPVPRHVDRVWRLIHEKYYAVIECTVLASNAFYTTFKWLNCCLNKATEATVYWWYSGRELQMYKDYVTDVLYMHVKRVWFLHNICLCTMHINCGLINTNIQPYIYIYLGNIEVICNIILLFT